MNVFDFAIARRDSNWRRACKNLGISIEQYRKLRMEGKRYCPTCNIIYTGEYCLDCRARRKKDKKDKKNAAAFAERKNLHGRTVRTSGHEDWDEIIRTIRARALGMDEKEIITVAPEKA